MKMRGGIGGGRWLGMVDKKTLIASERAVEKSALTVWKVVAEEVIFQKASMSQPCVLL